MADFIHSSILAACVSEGFIGAVEEKLVPMLKEKFGDGYLGIQMYEDYIDDKFVYNGSWYYPLTVLLDGGRVTQWILWPYGGDGSFADGIPYAYVGEGSLEFSFADYVPASFEEALFGRNRYADGNAIAVSVSGPSKSPTFLCGKFSQTFIDEMARQLTLQIEKTFSVTGLSQSGIELEIPFAPGTYMEHTSEGTTYRRMLITDGTRVVRDFWVKWERLDGAGAYGIADAPRPDTIRFTLGEDVPPKIREKEYRFLLRSSPDKYRTAMGRKNVVAWHEVLKRAADRGTLYRVITNDTVAKGEEVRTEAPGFEQFADVQTRLEEISKKRDSDMPMTDKDRDMLDKLQSLMNTEPEAGETTPTGDEELERVMALARQTLSENRQIDAEAERAAREKEEADRRAEEEARLAEEAAARAEAERIAREEARLAEEEAARLAEEQREEEERLTREETERIARETAEAAAREVAERLAREEVLRREKEEAERIAREAAEAEARAEAERAAREEAERVAREEEERRRIEEERAARAEAERLAREEELRREIRAEIEREYAEREAARREALRLERENAERLAREEAERRAREEAERIARENAARAEAERLAREDAERREREEADRIAEERRRVEEALRAEDARHRAEILRIEEEKRAAEASRESARQRAEEERIAEEAKREEQRRAAEAARIAAEQKHLAEVRAAEAARAEAEAKQAADAPTYHYTSKCVHLYFRYPVDPNINKRIHTLMKDTIDYFGKQDVFISVRSNITSQTSVDLVFLQIPEEEHELLINIINVLGRSDLGVSKIVLDENGAQNA